MFSPVINDSSYFFSVENIDLRKIILEKRYKKRIRIFGIDFNFNDLKNKKGEDDYFVLDISREPINFRKISNKQVIENKHFFDMILTWDEEILNNCNNSKKVLYGNTWIKRDDAEMLIKNKEFNISFLCGGKNITCGHKMRHRLWKRQKEIIGIEKKFFISEQSSVRPVDNNVMLSRDWSKKYKLFFSQFHIVIENVSEKGYFSEKLIDCLHTKTIPIYFGCSDVHKYFDDRGFFVAKNEDDMINICNNIKSNTYNEMKKFCDINYKISLEYCEELIIRYLKIIDMELERV